MSKATTALPRPASLLVRHTQIPVDASPLSPNRIVDCEETTLGQTNDYAVGDLIIRVSARKTAHGCLPVVKVTAPTGETISVDGVVGFDKAGMKFAVGKVDPSSSINQVLFTSYSGGAHCCAAFKLVHFLDGRWNVAWGKIIVGQPNVSTLNPVNYILSTTGADDKGHFSRVNRETRICWRIGVTLEGGLAHNGDQRSRFSVNGTDNGLQHHFFCAS